MTFFNSGKMFRRSIIAALSAAVIGLAFASTAASARPGGGFHGGGFHGGGFHRGGFHHGGFHRGFGFRRFGPAIGLGIGLGVGYPYYAGYYGYDGCLAPRRVWTPYGWRFRYVNVCGYGYY
jgi:hypothetical protein